MSKIWDDIRREGYNEGFSESYRNTLLKYYGEQTEEFDVYIIRSISKRLSISVDEVMNILEVSNDKKERYRQLIKEGWAMNILLKNKSDDIYNVMKYMNISIDKAMEMLNIPEDKREEYRKLVEDKLLNDSKITQKEKCDE